MKKYSPCREKLREEFDAKGPNHVIWYLALYRPVGSVMPTIFFDKDTGYPVTGGSVDQLRDKLTLLDTAGIEVFITPVRLGSKEPQEEEMELEAEPGRCGKCDDALHYSCDDKMTPWCPYCGEDRTENPFIL